MSFLEELRADHNKRSSSRPMSEEDSVRLMVRKLIYEPMKLAIREEAHRTFSDHISGDYLISTEYYGRLSPVPAHGPFWDSEFIDDSEVLHLHPLCTVKSSRIFGITATVSLTSAGRQVIDILSELASADGIPVIFLPALEISFFRMGTICYLSSIFRKKCLATESTRYYNQGIVWNASCLPAAL